MFRCKAAGPVLKEGGPTAVPPWLSVGGSGVGVRGCAPCPASASDFVHAAPPGTRITAAHFSAERSPSGSRVWGTLRKAGGASALGCWAVSASSPGPLEGMHSLCRDRVVAQDLLGSR